MAVTVSGPAVDGDVGDGGFVGGLGRRLVGLRPRLDLAQLGPVPLAGHAVSRHPVGGLTQGLEALRVGLGVLGRRRVDLHCLHGNTVRGRRIRKGNDAMLVDRPSRPAAMRHLVRTAASWRRVHDSSRECGEIHFYRVIT